MEQVFVEVSSLLQKNKATQQRQLRIRTYNVVPLDGTSGAIEFVQNTTPLMSFLQPAHTKYHPDEWRWQTVRTKWHRLVDAKAGPKERMKLWQDVVKRFTPVMRHFFFERFDEPDVWFERRLAYTRSTAANSILGHIVGLGDRHNQNILLDAHSGEMIHIDLGVAFDSGRVLPMPELVPFRLTRDIVDGFGVLGTEGVFRRCCEFTFEALRENKDTIMTLLNVLRYDPLHNWTLSPLRARRLQKEQDTAGSTPVATPLPTRTSTRRSLGGMGVGPVGVPGVGQSNVAGLDIGSDEGGEADRALSVVEKKLGKQLSVQATVNELIQQATDGANLALLFTGMWLDKWMLSREIANEINRLGCLGVERGEWSSLGPFSVAFQTLIVSALNLEDLTDHLLLSPAYWAPEGGLYSLYLDMQYFEDVSKISHSCPPHQLNFALQHFRVSFISTRQRSEYSYQLYSAYHSRVSHSSARSQVGGSTVFNSNSNSIRISIINRKYAHHFLTSTPSQSQRVRCILLLPSNRASNLSYSAAHTTCYTVHSAADTVSDCADALAETLTYAADWEGSVWVYPQVKYETRWDGEG